jgi:neural Wiskott-Aldrich syndrome protein
MQGGGDAVSRAPALDESLARAHQLAIAQGHGTVALEHLLFALTEDADAVSILGASRISVEQLRTDVSGHLGRMSEGVQGDPGAAPRPGADLLRILQLAGMAARQSQRRLMDGGIVLAAIIGDGNSPAAGLLKAHGLTFEDVIRVLQTAGSPRQQELQAPPVRAELPPPQAPAQSPPAASAKAPPRDIPKPSAGDDALAAARARVRQSEPAAMKPYVQAPAQPPAAQATPIDATPRPAGLPGGGQRSGQPLPPPAVPRQDVRPLSPDQSNAPSSGVQDWRSDAPHTGTLSEPPPVSLPQHRRDAGRPPPMPKLEVDRLEPARARVPSLPAEPITVPVTAPPMEQSLARLRPSAPAPPPQTSYAPAPPPQGPPPRPMAPPHQQRPVPAVAPRPQTPYPSLPPPGPGPMGARPLAPNPPMPQRADLPPLPPPPQAQPSHGQTVQMPPPHALLPSEPLEIVHAAAGLPAVVRRNIPVLVEIRIPRAQVDVPRHGPQASTHGASIVRAVTTRLTGGPVSGLSIEPRTPETAWLGPADADSRDVIWQYVLLPTRSGTFAVTLSVAGRTFSPGGMMNDASTAAETFAVRVKP